MFFTCEIILLLVNSYSNTCFNNTLTIQTVFVTDTVIS